MGIFGDLFGKKRHDPAQALIEWLDGHPHACRRTVAGHCGAQHLYSGRALTWILTRTDCDRGTACDVFWETLAMGGVEELLARRADPLAATPRLEMVRLIDQRWRADLYGPAEFGFDSTNHWQYFCKKLRKFGCKAADFDLPEGIRGPIPGERFSHQWPACQDEHDLLYDLIQDMWVCDSAIEMPDQWLPIRKKRLGY